MGPTPVAFAPYIRLVFGGTIDGSQTWSCGLSILSAGAPSNSDLFAWLTPIDTAVKAMLNAGLVAAKMWDAGTIYNRLHAYHYSALGGPDAQAQLVSTGFGGSATVSLPRQTSLVASLRSGLGGRADRGRLYMPFTGTAALTGVGQAPTATCDALANGVEGLIHTINTTAIGTGTGIVCIASRASGATVTVENVIVNSKPDTQRRRTDKLLSTYQKSTPVT